MKRQVTIFVGVVSLILALLYGLIFVLKLPLFLLFPLLLLLVFIAAFFPTLMEFKEYERGVVFRFGKYYKTVGPGWRLIFSIIDRVVLVDLRIQSVDPPSLSILTKDNLTVTIDPILFYRVSDPKRYVIEIKEYKTAAVALLQTELRDIIGKMILEEVLEKVDEINKRVLTDLIALSEPWGVVPTKVDVQALKIPPELVKAMELRRKAEERKEAIRHEMEARELVINTIDRATKGLNDKTLAYFYLQSLKDVADGKATKIVYPLELSKLARLLSGSIAPSGKQDTAEGSETSEGNALIASIIKRLKEQE
ncbi:hypothetical protein HY991_00490 [Candidatus Micrarchaeota archaeon]|nr:hypothetical protein [Candidatus Micrarchaeota archaeon]